MRTDWKTYWTNEKSCVSLIWFVSRKKNYYPPESELLHWQIGTEVDRSWLQQRFISRTIETASAHWPIKPVSRKSRDSLAQNLWNQLWNGKKRTDHMFGKRDHHYRPLRRSLSGLSLSSLFPRERARGSYICCTSFGRKNYCIRSVSRSWPRD